MAEEYLPALDALIANFKRLPGIGHKTAVRMAFSVLDFSEDDAHAFADAIVTAKEKIIPCEVCGYISEGGKCEICSSDRRDRSVICVVEDSRAVMALEKVREFKGLYHVLGGAISPMDGIGPDELNIRSLLTRLDGVDEVIIATNPTIEGETTAMYISKLIKPLGIKTSRLAYGVPVGGELEYSDEVTLFRAIEGRRDL
jgi:recombination protein RecR